MSLALVIFVALLLSHHNSLFLTLSLLFSSLSFSCHLSFFSLNGNDNDHSYSELSMYSQLCLGMGLGPFPVCRNVHIMQKEFVLVLCRPRTTWHEVGLFLCWRWRCACARAPLACAVVCLYCFVLCCWSCVVPCRFASVVFLLVRGCVLDCRRCDAGCVFVVW